MSLLKRMYIHHVLLLEYWPLSGRCLLYPWLEKLRKIHILRERSQLCIFFSICVCMWRSQTQQSLVPLQDLHGEHERCMHVLLYNKHNNEKCQEKQKKEKRSHCKLDIQKLNQIATLFLVHWRQHIYGPVVKLVRRFGRVHHACMYTVLVAPNRRSTLRQTKRMQLAAAAATISAHLIIN
jgi:hypothetical protein